MCDLFYPARVGEICLGARSESHVWYYYPAMLPDELQVFVTYDSRFDSPVRMTAHCAFDDPTAPAAAPPQHRGALHRSTRLIHSYSIREKEQWK